MDWRRLRQESTSNSIYHLSHWALWWSHSSYFICQPMFASTSPDPKLQDQDKLWLCHLIVAWKCAGCPLPKDWKSSWNVTEKITILKHGGRRNVKETNIAVQHDQFQETIRCIYIHLFTWYDVDILYAENNYISKRKCTSIRPKTHIKPKMQGLYISYYISIWFYMYIYLTGLQSFKH